MQSISIKNSSSCFNFSAFLAKLFAIIIIAGCSEKHNYDKKFLVDFYFSCEGKREVLDRKTQNSMISQRDFVLGFRRKFSEITGSYSTKYVYIDGKYDSITDKLSEYQDIADIEYRILYTQYYAGKRGEPTRGIMRLDYNFMTKKGTSISFDNIKYSNNYEDKFHCSDIVDEKYLKMIINRM